MHLHALPFATTCPTLGIYELDGLTCPTMHSTPTHVPRSLPLDSVMKLTQHVVDLRPAVDPVVAKGHAVPAIPTIHP